VVVLLLVLLTVVGNLVLDGVDLTVTGELVFGGSGLITVLVGYCILGL